MSVSRRRIAGWTLGVLVAAALAGEGCSHGPKPTAEPAPGPAEGTHAAARAHREAKDTKDPKPATEPSASDGVVTGSSTTAAADSSSKKPVVPTLTAAQAKELEFLSKNDVEATETMLKGVDASKLDADRSQKYQIAKGFLADAITARAQQDWMKAAQLATKAKMLAEQVTGP